ncbi:MAG: orotidine 5'-phosphate decarboxylase / HUMPS family protein [Thermoproteota archaeon]|nr:orotidine 5'-phosphate decarboxylase [Candidatus Brockarchaeota archaeon]MBO3768490.1 orotidine 5'-phosphate decarboxylase [Candidatus Brockarchaeota archaeon]MBO3802127.1 orotidine 5'-phosphate decarboxylase [Candidatus Brockarchaeota archaeon]
MRKSSLGDSKYLQIALDFIDLNSALELVRKIPKEKDIIFEVGTPLIKSEGIRAISTIKHEVKENIIIADLKTLDVGEIEVEIAKLGEADGAVVSALAPKKTIEKFLTACKKANILAVVDLIGYTGDLSKLKEFSKNMDILLFHSGIDEGSNIEYAIKRAKEIKEMFPEITLAMAGGLTSKEILLLLNYGVDIFVVGRYITNAQNPAEKTIEILNIIRKQK